MLRRLWIILLVLALTGAAIGASSASADSGVIPDTPDLPWADASHNTPLEQLASQIASGIAQRPVRVYCNGQSDWDALARSTGFDGARIWGYVPAPRYWYPALGTFAESSTHTQLSTIACERLWLFAKATTKPTKCAASRAATTTQQVKVRYQVTVRVKVKKRVKVNGKWVTRWVYEKRRVWRTRIETRTMSTTVPVDPLPCYGTAAADVTVASPNGGWSRYMEFVFAVQTLAHESIHLWSFTANRPVPTSTQQEESRAECWGMQLIPSVATSLGASPEDALAMAKWYAEQYYPGRQSSAPDYWSADCRVDGGLDRTPGDGHWPLQFEPPSADEALAVPFPLSGLS